MKALILALSFVVFGAGMVPTDAEARRFGGGGFSGMKRNIAPKPPAAVPGKPAQAAPGAPAGATAAAAASKRSWMGPIAGLAAGLGIVALMSHLGLGAELANFVMLALLVLAAIFAIRFVMNRFGRNASSPRMATPGGMQFSGGAPQRADELLPRSGAGAPQASMPVSAAPAAAALPADFDAASFERIAKMIFIRMQTANDSADLDDLRAFTTPEMFAAVKLELQERGGVAQTTDVVRIDSEVLDVATEAERHVVSVRFHGLIREERDGPAAPFDEIWHLVKPLDGSREWAIAGIQQTEAA